MYSSTFQKNDASNKLFENSRIVAGCRTVLHVRKRNCFMGNVSPKYFQFRVVMVASVMQLLW
jgi:hypothetical protein